MWRWLIVVLLMVWPVGCGGALMSPDEDDLARLTRALQKLIDRSGEDIKRWTANRRAAEWFAGQDKDARLYTLKCRNAKLGRESDPPLEFDVTVQDMLSCLLLGAGDGKGPPGGWVFNSCINYLDSKAAGWFVQQGYTISISYDGGPASCDRIEGPAWDPRPDWDPANVTAEDVARTLTSASAPPAWLVAAGGAAALGTIAPELLPILCTMTVGWACPDNPQYPEGDR